MRWLEKRKRSEYNVTQIICYELSTLDDPEEAKEAER